MKYHLLLITISSLVFSCSKQKTDLPNIPPEPPTPPPTINKALPTISTVAVTSITETYAISGCNLSSNGKDSIQEMGICYSTGYVTTPTVLNEKIFIKKEVNTFTDTLKKLAPNTTYYVRAYAINSVGKAYGQVISFKTQPYTIKDYDGNVYNIIKIGDQYWTKENFKCTHYNNGNEIKRQLIIKDFPGYWNEIGAYCYYNDDIELYKKYGAIYNWLAGSVWQKMLVPIGWHIPTKDEFDIMVNFVNSSTPKVDFYLLLGGTRNDYENEYAKKYQYIDLYGYFWASSSQETAGYNDFFRMYINGYGKIVSTHNSYPEKPDSYHKSPGCYVRLVKD